MSARTLRTRLFAASALSLAALSLTACGGGTDTDGAGTSSPVAAAQSDTSGSAQTSGSTGSGGTTGTAASTGTTGSTSGAKGGTTGTGAGTGGSTGTGTTTRGTSGGTGTTTGTAGKGKTSSGGAHSTGDDSASFTRCGAAQIRITAVTVPRPINHLLLTATNKGSKRCLLSPYPAARFGEAQSVPPVAEETKPQALVSLEPGESGYAGVRLSGDGDHGHTVTTLTVPFDDGSIATVKLPGKSVYVDDSLTVTYWQSTMEYVVDF
ncbi:DUF4232 domain-containing protein [Streptomyces sp. GMY01]|uniref:DUF4232 domain-containing protein n=1 Tax=Streptomyces sp. GMY02 TaxID=1333528 RepID=UPI00146CDA9C|nr:DUF4232 domain-containing protein [Streptomyces sp. GMY02]NMO35093.1 DUF4232 domain-containing protein [Streptomyces sp. GMY02]